MEASALTTFIGNVTTVLGTVKSSLSVFLEPPIIYFVALAGVVATVGVIKKLLPMRRA